MIFVGGEIEVVDGYVASLGEEAEGYGPADACYTAGYDGCFAC